MSLSPRSSPSFWNRIMSAVNNIIRSPSPPITPQNTVVEVEPPRKRRRKGLAMNKAGYSKPENRNADLFTKADYTIDGPYRRVPPYYFTYYTWAKERWYGVPLLQLFCSEFRDRQPEYYRAAIASGSVNVNGKAADENYVVQNGDCISHMIHRHEPPVPSRPIKIIHHDPESGLLVINKPAGIPVHPSGRYHQNSIATILRLEHGFTEVLPCNRLDRLTSGVMIMALNKTVARQIHTQLMQRTVFKEYYCRVTGNFPDGEVTVDKPIAVVSPKHTLNRLREDGKPSSTVFRKLFYDERRNQSVVLAKPLTGRTHQIRVHLQYLGHPIANDPIYANTQVFTSPDDYVNARDEDLIARLENMGKSVASTTLADALPEESTLTSMQGLDGPEFREMWSGAICDVCGTRLYLDPAPGEFEIWLHAWKYGGTHISGVKGKQGDVWSYESDIPEWGREDWQGNQLPRRRRSSSPPALAFVLDHTAERSLSIAEGNIVPNHADA